LMVTHLTFASLKTVQLICLTILLLSTLINAKIALCLLDLSKVLFSLETVRIVLFTLLVSNSDAVTLITQQFTSTL